MSLRFYFRKFEHWFSDKFGPPSPVELGKSKRNALPLRDITGESGDVYCWEDWDKEVQKGYPIRYFIGRTLPRKISTKIIMPIDNFFYWLRTNTINKYHLLDLRQPKTNTQDDYRWGWIDECDKLVLANFSVLRDYMEDCQVNKSLIYGPNDESIKELEKELVKSEAELGQEDIGLRNQIKYLKEIKDIWEYWTVNRKNDLKYINELSMEWSKTARGPERDKKFDYLHKIEKEFEEQEEDILIRLIKVRKGLWV